MKRILVTGATGFIGQHLVRRLRQRNCQVRCLIRNESRRASLPFADIDFAIADFRNLADLEKAVRGCDGVYHLAALTSARHRSELYETNATGCHLLAQACSKQPTPPKLIIVSSLAAGGPAVRGRERRERDRPRPVSDYGRSKRAGERAAAQFASEVPISIIRPGIVFGPGNRDMLPMFQSIAQFRLHLVPGFTSRRVGLIYYEDLLEAFERVEKDGETLPALTQADAAITKHSKERAESTAETDGCGRGLYVACDPDFPTYAELGRMIARSLSITALVLPISETLVLLAAAGNQWLNYAIGQTDTFNLDKMREAFGGHWVASTDKLDRLGFRPTKPLQARLDETAQWYREQGWIANGRARDKRIA